MSEYKQRPLGREHTYVHTSFPGHQGAPYTRCIYGHPGSVFLLFACLMIDHPYAKYPTVFHHERDELSMGKYLCSMTISIQCICQCQSERVNRSIGDSHGTDDMGIHRGFQPLGFLRSEHICSDACIPASFHKLALIGKIIFRQSDEEAVMLLHIRARYAT